jgi:hypothetical protein
MVASSLNVEGGEVGSPLLPRLLEHVVRHLLGHRVVHRLRHLHQKLQSCTAEKSFKCRLYIYNRISRLIQDYGSADPDLINIYRSRTSGWLFKYIQSCGFSSLV